MRILWYNNFRAGVAELADAPDLGSGVPDVKVQGLSPVPEETLSKDKVFFIKSTLGVGG